MGQTEVFAFLKKNKNRTYSVKDIAEKTGAEKGRVGSNVKQLHRFGFIKFIQTKRNLHIERRYYVDEDK